MTISGRIPRTAPAVGVEFIPLAKAQTYMARLGDELAELDGGPVYLVHDMETGTSDITISELTNALVGGEGWSNLPLTKLLRACFSEGTSFRIWMADNDPKAHIKNARETDSLAAVASALEAHHGAWWHAPANNLFRLDAPNGPRA